MPIVLKDGMVEKQEFLMDLLDIFNDRFVQPIENRQNDKSSIHPFLHHGKCRTVYVISVTAVKWIIMIFRNLL